VENQWFSRSTGQCIVACPESNPLYDFTTKECHDDNVLCDTEKAFISMTDDGMICHTQCAPGLTYYFVNSAGERECTAKCQATYTTISPNSDLADLDDY